MNQDRGQVLIGVIVLLIIIAVMVPSMVRYVQDEAKWSVKQAQNTNAFQLAEAAVDRGYQKITESTNTWISIQNGTAVSGFNFDTAYTDIARGSYAISITSGPGTQVATILGIGRDKFNKEVRTLKVVYANYVLADVGLLAANGVVMSGANVDVEWGSVASPKSVTIGSKLHPSYWSAGSIDIDPSGSAPFNCDQPNCWWWHSYYSQLPPMPSVDFDFYRSSAVQSGKNPCGSAYYQAGNYSDDCNDSSGKPYYVSGNWTSFKSAVVGSMIVLGDLTFDNGKQSTLSSYSARVPAKAWKQYCNDWTAYQAYDSGAASASACFGGLTNSYSASGVTKSISPAIHGFVYVGGTLTIPKGGGNSDLLHGVAIIQGTANIDSNSHAHIYYDPDVAENIVTTKIVLIRQSWQDIVRDWPF